MDITAFITFFIDQVVSIFTWFFGILANFKFLGTDLLIVIITISILGALIPVILTISQNFSINSSRSERVKGGKVDDEHRAKITRI